MTIEEYQSEYDALRSQYADELYHLYLQTDGVTCEQYLEVFNKHFTTGYKRSL
jgi:hypothetical protein